MTKHASTRYLSIFISFVILFFPLMALTDTLGEVSVFLLPKKESFLNPELLELSLMVTVSSTTVGAVLGAVEYDHDFVEILSYTPHPSFCALSPFQYIDNHEGQFILACGDPAGASTTFSLADIIFIKKQAGRAAFVLSDFIEAYALGTSSKNIITSRELHYIEILK